jgi:sec-independent protein translocase protein TatA
MGSLSLWHWAVVLAIVVLLFGRGRISSLMGDIGGGLGILRRELRGKKKINRDVS